VETCTQNPRTRRRTFPDDLPIYRDSVPTVKNTSKGTHDETPRTRTRARTRPPPSPRPRPRWAEGFPGRPLGRLRRSAAGAAHVGRWPTATARRRPRRRPLGPPRRPGAWLRGHPPPRRAQRRLLAAEPGIGVPDPATPGGRRPGPGD